MKEELKKPDELNKTPNEGNIKNSTVHQGSLKSILQITLWYFHTKTKLDTCMKQHKSDFLCIAVRNVSKMKVI